MFKILFLILVVMSLAIFAQENNNSSIDKKVPAKIFDEFGKVTTGLIRSRMDSFLVELQKNPSSQGYIINYGTKKDIAARERLLRNHVAFRKFDSVRIVFVNGGFRGEIKTEFWIVPYGAEIPNIESASKKIDEFGFLNYEEMEARLSGFLSELQNNPNKKAYILTTGASKAVLRRENS